MLKVETDFLIVPSSGFVLEPGMSFERFCQNVDRYICWGQYDEYRCRFETTDTDHHPFSCQALFRQVDEQEAVLSEVELRYLGIEVHDWSDLERLDRWHNRWINRQRCIHAALAESWGSIEVVTTLAAQSSDIVIHCRPIAPLRLTG
jgi:hypothetical protein